jgi:D-3-phosphoglycerate dehydrogenase
LVKIVLDLDGIAKYYSFPQDQLERMRTLMPGHEFERCQEASNALDADIWVCWRIDPELFRKLANLKLIIYAADGMGKHRLYPEIVNSGVAVCNSRGCRSQAVAEHAMMLALACSKQLRPMIESVDKDGWWGLKVVNQERKPFTLQGKTMGIIGLGEIGSRIASIAKHGFGMRVVGIQRTPRTSTVADEVMGMADLPRLLSQSDVIMVALPDTDETSRLLDEKTIPHIKRGAILVNIARGNVISTQALIDAVNSGVIRSAGLDVFETEPLPEDSPLRQMRELVLTPHAASSSADFWPCFADVIIKNVANLAKGKPLVNTINKSLGY